MFVVRLGCLPFLNQNRKLVKNSQHAKPNLKLCQSGVEEILLASTNSSCSIGGIEFLLTSRSVIRDEVLEKTNL